MAQEPTSDVSPAQLQAAMTALEGIRIECSDSPGHCGSVLEWRVIDTATADPEVNWPGGLVATCDTFEAAAVEQAREVVRRILAAGVA